ncbi:MAG: hypothetical protein HZA16_05825 [Nitrospirae bacterium]|nr:hypothetical protein [Nitrospirota bacterium]
MCNIPGVGNQWGTHYPIQNRLNYMTTNLIKDKDANQDNVLNAEELGIDAEAFARIDRNEDGQAGRTELAIDHPLSRINHMTAALIKDKDTNQDNVLNAEELGINAETFARIDRNEDGQAGIKELIIAHPLSRINHMSATLIKDKDTNQDSVLNAEELGIDAETFARIDRNEDGQADRREINIHKFKILSNYQSLTSEQSDPDVSVSV